MQSMQSMQSILPLQTPSNMANIETHHQFTVFQPRPTVSNIPDYSNLVNNPPANHLINRPTLPTLPNLSTLPSLSNIPNGRNIPPPLNLSLNLQNHHLNYESPLMRSNSLDSPHNLHNLYNSNQQQHHSYNLHPVNFSSISFLSFFFFLSLNQ